jgi:Arc/MetJ-type ribon-helix-helix transcriptional regulator
MPSKSTFTASLTPELTAFPAVKAASVHYRSAGEVLRAALRLPVEQERHLDWGKHSVGEPDAR